MPVSLEGKFVVALSSRALFDFEEENRVFEEANDSAYMALQLERMERAARQCSTWGSPHSTALAVRAGKEGDGAEHARSIQRRSSRGMSERVPGKPAGAQLSGKLTRPENIAWLIM